MGKITFIKGAVKYYLGELKHIARSLFPKTVDTTVFWTDRKEYLDIKTTWMGQEIRHDVFLLANRPEREEYLKFLLEHGEISEEEYEKSIREG